MGFLVVIWKAIAAAAVWVWNHLPIIIQVGEKTKKTIDEVSGIFQGKEKLNAIEKIPNRMADAEIFQLKQQASELIICSQFAERFSANLEIHISNLQTHFHAIRNICLLAEFSKWSYNRLESLSKAVFKNNKQDKEFKKANVIFENLAKSIEDHYWAFDKTKKLIEAECLEFFDYLIDQEKKIDNILVSIDKVNAPSKGALESWLKKDVKPRIEKAKKHVAGLQDQMATGFKKLDIPEDIKKLDILRISDGNKKKQLLAK